MKKQISLRSSLIESSLNPHNYLVSLLNAAFTAQLVTETDLQTIQFQMMDLFRNTVFQFTSGQSSSVPAETAHFLLNSILYCIDAYLLTLDSPEDSLHALHTSSISEIYREGLALVESCVTETRQLFQHTQANRTPTSLIAYNSTLDKGLPGFFAHYDPRFRAQDTMADIDYPLANILSNQRGIFYINEYIQKLNLENQFCAEFAEDDISRLLQNYGRTYHIDYREFLLNIFEIVLINTLFAVMLGQDPRNLTISETDCAFLYSKLASLDSSLLPALLNQTADRAVVQLKISNADLVDYIKQAQKNLTPRLLNVLQNNSLDKLVIIDYAPGHKATTTLKQGEVLLDVAIIYPV